MFRIFAVLALLLPVVAIGCAGQASRARQAEEYAKEPGLVPPPPLTPIRVWAR
jgi:hypothetical protein